MSQAEHVAQTVTQCGAALAVCSGTARWLVENHQLISSIGVLVGIAVAIAGFAMNAVFKVRAERLGLCELDFMRARARQGDDQ